MPDEPKSVDGSELAGFIPEQETPEEKPPVTDASEEQTTVEETPVTTDSETEDAEPATVDADEAKKLEEDRAFFQTESQKAKEDLKRFKEQYADQQVFDEQPKVVDPAPEQTQTQGEFPDFGTMTREEINDFLRENPVIAVQYQNFETERMLNERDQRIEARTRYQEEAKYTIDRLNQFCEKNKIETSKIMEVRDDLQKIGVKGSPTAIGGLIIDRLNAEMRSANINQFATEAAAKAAQAAKQQLATTQPGSSGAPETPEQTREQEIAAKFTQSHTAKVLEGFF